MKHDSLCDLPIGGISKVGTPAAQIIAFEPPSVGELTSLTNQAESKSFLATALAWHGSVTPRVIPRVAVAAAYATAVCWIATFFPNFLLPITPFEYSGAVLALLIVLRVNAGHDRWWEARKIWGGIMAGAALIMSIWADLHVFFFTFLMIPGWIVLCVLLSLTGNGTLVELMRTVRSGSSWPLLFMSR